MIRHRNFQSFNSSLFQDWFKDHPEVKLEYFPMKSEDLNPFKIVWNEFVGALRLQRLQPKDAEEIWAGIEELWFSAVRDYHIGMDFFSHSVLI